MENPREKDGNAEANVLKQLLLEHENRLNRLDWEMGILSKQIPTARRGQIIWWVNHIYWIMLPVTVFVAVTTVPDPWNKTIGGILVGAHLGKYVMDLTFTALKGPRKINSILLNALKESEND